jgi:tRNA pseudouridine38-40 synthase
MNFYKAIISYDGSTFCGWQFQTVNSDTAQEFLQTTLRGMAKTESLKLYGASRTDKGVHASFQVVRIESEKELQTENFIRGFNQAHGSRMKILSFESIESSFNPLNNIDYKEYHYYFSSQETLPFLNHLIHTSRYVLDIESMIEASRLIEGSHDFKSLSVKGSRESNDTNREILFSNIEKANFGEMDNNDIYVFKIRSKGFLKYMVRMLMGTLLEIGQGKISLEEFKNQLEGQKGFDAPRAPAKGLNLFFIKYK